MGVCFIPLCDQSVNDITDQLQHKKSDKGSTVATCLKQNFPKMMCYTVIATLCLLGMAAAQTSLSIASCVTKEQNLQMNCTFTPATNPDAKQSVCYFMNEGKLVASSNSTATPEPQFKNRGKVTFEQKMCQLTLTGFADTKPQNFTCFIKQMATPVSQVATVEKSKLKTCSAWCTLQHSAVVFILVFITSPLMLEFL